MAPPWSWDFEDPHKPQAKPPAPPRQSPPHAPAQADGRRTPSRQIRRRRAAAAVIAVAVLALVVAVASSSHGKGGSGSSTLRSGRHVAVKRAPSDPEKDEYAAVKSVLAYTPFARAGGSRGRDIALTFDDGPGPYTPQVLSVLERMHVRATFFTIGKMLRYFGTSTVREIEDGDVIGDHTESHPELARLSRHDQFEELFEQIARVEILGGHRPVLFRPPYGSFNATTMKQLAKLHLLMVLWSVDTNDYLQPGVSTIVQRALEGAHPGAIILLHDAGGVRTQTIQALPLIIEGLRKRGYRLVTVPRLLIDDPPPAGEPLPPNLSGD